MSSFQFWDGVFPDTGIIAILSESENDSEEAIKILTKTAQYKNHQIQVKSDKSWSKWDSFVAGANPNTVIIINTTSAIFLFPWIRINEGHLWCQPKSWSKKTWDTASLYLSDIQFEQIQRLSVMSSTSDWFIWIPAQKTWLRWSSEHSTESHR